MTGLEHAPLDRDEQAADWCVRIAEAPLSPDEQREFEAWQRDPENAAALEYALLAWRNMGDAAEKPEVVRIRAAALDRFRAANGRRWVAPGRRRAWLGAIAAALLVALVSTFAFLSHDPVETFATAVGERRTVTLADGSRVSLDGATSVEVRLRPKFRELKLLQGRAKFDVAKDSLRPFSVWAKDKLVVATGTSFSVELLNRSVRVLLYEGRVDVLEKPTADAVPRPLRLAGRSRGAGAPALTPGSELVSAVAASDAVVLRADVSRSLSWEAGQLVFEDEPLPLAAERMNRYSKLLLATDATAADLRVSGTFTAGDTAAFVEGMVLLHDLRALRSEGKITLARR